MADCATNDIISMWFDPPQEPYRCCRDLAGDGCSECAEVFKIDDYMIRALIARLERHEGAKFWKRIPDRMER